MHHLSSLSTRLACRCDHDRRRWPCDHARCQQPALGKAAWPFTRPYDVILNLAVGDDWGGQKGIDDGAFPQRMTLDYVRYWRSR